VSLTGEDVRDIEGILVALNRTLGSWKDATPTVAACYRALKVLRAMKT
jgi:hypothetical protein